MQIFCDMHSSASALYAYKDELHILALSDEELIEILADRAINLRYNYIANLFKHYRNSQLGKRNRISMF